MTSNVVANSVAANGVATNGVATIISSLPRWSLNDPLARATNQNSAQNGSNISTTTTPQSRLEAEVPQPPKPSPIRVAPPPPPPPPQAPLPPTQPTPPTAAQQTAQQGVEEEPLPNGWEIRFDTFGRFVLFFALYLLSFVMTPKSNAYDLSNYC
jgi:type IV secretory pathway VirB10-like protein